MENFTVLKKNRKSRPGVSRRRWEEKQTLDRVQSSLGELRTCVGITSGDPGILGSINHIPSQIGSGSRLVVNTRQVATSNSHVRLHEARGERPKSRAWVSQEIKMRPGNRRRHRPSFSLAVRHGHAFLAPFHDVTRLKESQIMAGEGHLSNYYIRTSMRPVAPCIDAIPIQACRSMQYPTRQKNAQQMQII